MYERWVDDFEGLALDALDEFAVDEPVMGRGGQQQSLNSETPKLAGGGWGQTHSPKGCSYFTPLGSEICCVRGMVGEDV